MQEAADYKPKPFEYDYDRGIAFGSWGAFIGGGPCYAWYTFACPRIFGDT